MTGRAGPPLRSSSRTAPNAGVPPPSTAETGPTSPRRPAVPRAHRSWTPAGTPSSCANTTARRRPRRPRVAGTRSPHLRQARLPDQGRRRPPRPHLGAGEYDTTLGRFISVDPIHDLNDPQQWNAYSYAGDNPVTTSDPTGLWARDPDLDDQFGHEKPGTGKYGNRTPGVGGGSSSSTDVDPGSATVTIDDVTKQGLYNRGYGSGTFTVNELLQWASTNTANWVYLCTSVTGRDSLTCDLNNPTLPHKSGWQELLEGSLIVGGYAGAAFCVLLIEICGPALVAMGEDEVAFAGSGNMIGGSNTIRTGASILRAGCSFRPDTPVLLADGTTKQIKDVDVGDDVASADPETGRKAGKPVTALHINYDTDLVDLTIADEHGNNAMVFRVAR